MTTGLNIFEALRESHERQRHYARMVCKTHGDCPERTESYRLLKLELHAHELAEERHFYVPMMMHDIGMDPSRHAIAEHHELDELMEDIDKTDPSSSAWLPLAKKLKEKVFHHLKEEEHKFFQMAGKILSEAEKHSLAKAYLETFDEAIANGGKSTH